MRKIKVRNLFITLFVIILIIGFSASVWKMMQFRDRLHEISDNKNWEDFLNKNKIYDQDLIVFFGDSEIALWPMATSFGTLPIINKGISGDWASKAVNRFGRDVLEHKPKLLIILIGTNDLGNGQPVETIIESIRLMISQAASQNIKVVLCSLLPVRNEFVENHPLEKISLINSKLKELSLQNHVDYVDFFSHLKDEGGFFRKDYTSDGLHPNRTGYLRMTQIILPTLINYIAGNNQ